MNLPFLGGVIGIGDPSQPPPYNVDQAKLNDRLHIFAQDSWKVRPRFTLNYGLAWSFESTLVNRDLVKPKYLAPVYGSDLSPTNNNYHNFSPALGFAWQPDKGAKTVVRGGFGIYYDTELLCIGSQERAFTGRSGTDEVSQSDQRYHKHVSRHFRFRHRWKPVPVGAALPRRPDNITLAQYLQLQNAQLPGPEGSTRAQEPKRSVNSQHRNQQAGNNFIPRIIRYSEGCISTWACSVNFGAIWCFPLTSYGGFT